VPEIIETEAIILTVVDDAKWKYSIEADIPAFDGDRSYKYLAWNKKQGPPPQVGATGLGRFEGYARSKFYVERGDLPAGPVDGTETQYMVTWNMVGFSAGATNGAGAISPTPTARTAQTASQGPSKASGTTYLPAPTPTEKLAKEVAKYRREIEGVNDRKAVSDLLAMAEPGSYTLDGLMEDASILAGWYNDRLAERLASEIPASGGAEEVIEFNVADSPLVVAAQEAGMIVTGVRKEVPDDIAGLSNRPDLDAWVKSKGFAKGDISRVIQDAGFASSAEYLADESNTVQGLAVLLDDALGSWRVAL